MIISLKAVSSYEENLFQKLKEFIRDHQDSYNTILGVVASGWESQKYSQGRISLLSKYHIIFIVKQNFQLFILL